MRTITKDIFLNLGGEKKGFRLTKPDAFSGVEILRIFLRMQKEFGDESLSVLDFVTQMSGDEIRSVMKSCLNHVEVHLPAGPNPIMIGDDWGYPELQHDAKTCFRLTLEVVSFTLADFFGEGGTTSVPVPPVSSR